MSIGFSSFVLGFDFEIVMWIFLGLSILGIGGWICDFGNFSFTIFVLFGDMGFSIRYFWNNGMGISCGFFLFNLWFCLTDFS